MKKSSLIGGVFVFLLGIMLGGWLTWKFKPLPQGMVAVPQETVDSLEAYKSLTDSLQVIADLPPDTVKVDSIVYVKEIKYVETTPTVELDTLGLLQYADTLFVEDEVNAWVKFKVRGFVKGNLEWGYQPIIKEIEALGVEIFSCGTCLKYYSLESALKVGYRGTTNHIVEGMKDFKRTVWIG